MPSKVVRARGGALWSIKRYADTDDWEGVSQFGVRRIWNHRGEYDVEESEHDLDLSEPLLDVTVVPLKVLDCEKCVMGKEYLQHMRMNGQQEPLTVDCQERVLDGVRRFSALAKLQAGFAFVRYSVDDGEWRRFRHMVPRFDGSFFLIQNGGNNKWSRASMHGEGRVIIFDGRLTSFKAIDEIGDLWWFPIPVIPD